MSHRFFFIIIGFSLVIFLSPMTVDAASCNNNTICEGFEDASCGDCQCSGGVVCGGLCYANLKKTACRNDILVSTDPQFRKEYCLTLKDCPKEYTCTVPGSCERGIPLKVQFDFPTRLHVNKWTNGIVTLTNTGTRTINTTIAWETYDLEIQTQNKKKPAHVYRRLILKPKKALRIPLRVRGTRVSRGAKFDSLASGILNMTVFILGKGGGNVMFAYHPFIIDSTTAQRCGTYRWSTDGVCVGSIFFPGGDCAFGKGCIDRMSGWNQAHDQRVHAEGTKKVRVIAIDIPKTNRVFLTSQHVQDVFQEIDTWYVREAERIAKRPMVRFTAQFDGHYTLKLSNYTFDGVDDLWSYLEKKTKKSFSDADFLIVVVPELPSMDIGSAAGLSFGKTILVSAKNGFDAVTLAHELAHGFGCKDLYERRYLCNYQWSESLLCAAAWISGPMIGVPEKRAVDSLSKRMLGNCAAEMGWSDQDNDGILDLDDPQITAVAPDGFLGIAISDLQSERGVTELEFSNRVRSMSSGGLVLRGTVITRETNQPVSADVTFTRKVRDFGSGEFVDSEEECLTEGGRFACVVFGDLDQTQTITVRATLDRFQTEQLYLFKP